MSYVSCLTASLFDENVVFASFDNHKQGDFNPYVLRSDDGGNSWEDISGNLPDRNIVYSIKQDHVNKDLLFAGTEFGVFFTIDGGDNWIQLKAGLPVISVKDIDIQKRENDLVLATFGRGFYILDDYSPLRGMNPANLDKKAHLFPIKDALLFVESRPMGGRGKAGQGEQFYLAKNPPVAAVFSLYLRDGIRSIKQKRKKKEKEAIKNDEEIPYPSLVELEKEDNERQAFLLFTIRDQNGQVVRKLRYKPRKGLNRYNWNLRTANSSYASKKPSSNGSSGWLVPEGKYTVEVDLYHQNKFERLVDKQNFKVISLNNLSMPATNTNGLLSFQNELNELNRQLQGTSKYIGVLEDKLGYFESALLQSPGEIQDLMLQTNSLQDKIRMIKIQVHGNPSISKRNENQKPSISSRTSNIVWGLMNNRSQPTQTMMDSYQIARKQLTEIMKKLKQLEEEELIPLEEKMEEMGAPYTPGRMPVIKK
jgi:hypothetical protein